MKWFNIVLITGDGLMAESNVQAKHLESAIVRAKCEVESLSAPWMHTVWSAKQLDVSYIPERARQFDESFKS